MPTYDQPGLKKSKMHMQRDTQCRLMIRSNDMTMDRRQFLATSAAATILPSLGAAKYYEHNLVAEPM